MSTLAGSGGDRDFVPNSFASQYISIILIIFTCIVWAFFSDSSRFSKLSRHAASPESPVVAAPIEGLPEVPALVSAPLVALPLEDLFDREGKVNVDMIDVIVTLLQNHNVNAELELGGLSEGDFAEARELESAFAKSQLPAGAVKILVKEGQGIKLKLRTFSRPGGAA